MSREREYDKFNFFSPDGKIYQLEYANIAVNNFDCGGIKFTNEGIIYFRIKKKISGEIKEIFEDEDIFKIEKNKYLILFGYSSDKRFLKIKLKEELEKYKSTFGFKSFKNEFIIEKMFLEKIQLQRSFGRYFAVNTILIDLKLNFFYFLGVGGKVIKMNEIYIGKEKEILKQIKEEKKIIKKNIKLNKSLKINIENLIKRKE